MGHGVGEDPGGAHPSPNSSIDHLREDCHLGSKNNVLHARWQLESFPPPSVVVLYLYRTRAGVSARTLVPGCLLCNMARRILKLPIMKYVEDFFSAGRRRRHTRPWTCLHGVPCVPSGRLGRSVPPHGGRLVKACLGETAIAGHKLEVGNSLLHTSNGHS